MVTAYLLSALLLFGGGCTVLSDGTRIPNILVVQDLSAFGAVAIITAANEQGLSVSSLLNNVRYAKQYVETHHEPVDLAALYEAFGPRVPKKYQMIAQMVAAILQTHVEPIVNSSLPTLEKEALIRDTIIAALTGIETGLRLNIANQT